ncbi:MAG: MG2 domain-containing protein [Desulfosarcinaceae bacterium]
MIKSFRVKPGILAVAVLLFAALTPVAGAQDFEVLFIGQQTIENNNAIAVTFSAEVDATRDINRFFTIFAGEEGRVDGAWVLTPKGNVAYFTNIEADRSYEVEVRKGLRAADGRTLAETHRRQVKTRAARAFISFDGKGYLLPDQLAEGLPVSTMNVTAADIDFFRVKPRRLVDFITFMGQQSELSYYHGEEIKRLCDLVYSARFDLKASKNVLAKAVLPIRGIEPLETPGLYLAVLRQAGTYPYSTPATYFSISDIGLHLRVYAQSMNVQVNQLITGKAYAGVSLTLYGKKGDVLEQVKSDKQGRAALSTPRSEARLLVATRGDHTSVLSMQAPALDLSAFDLGKQPFREIDLFVYGPRDLYRPGETVILDALLRDHDGRTLAHAAPIQARIKQPDGRQAKSFIWHGDSLDDFHYAYDLPPSVQTGTWSVAFDIGGRQIQRYSFKVEDFMPERMKLALDNGDANPKRIGPGEEIAMAVQGDYLYGAPAAGNRVDCRVSLAKARALIDKLPGFEFGDVDEQVAGGFTTDDVVLDAS